MVTLRCSRLAALVACALAAAAEAGCGVEASSSTAGSTAPDGLPNSGPPHPEPLVVLGFEVEHPEAGATRLRLLADVTDDGRFPEGSTILTAKLLVGTLEGDVGRLALDVSSLPAQGTAIELADLDFDAEIGPLAMSSDWFVLRVELEYMSGGMSIAMGFLTRDGEGFVLTTQEAFETARAGAE